MYFAFMLKLLVTIFLIAMKKVSPKTLAPAETEFLFTI